MSENYLNYFEGNYKIHCFSPSNILKPYLEDYSYFVFPSNKLGNRNIHPFPNGNIEIYFCLGNSKVQIKQPDKEYYIQHFLFGMFDLSDSTLFKIISDDLHYASFVVHLKFNSVKYLFSLPLGQFKNKLIDIEELWGQKGKDIKQFVSKQTDISVVVSFMNTFFESFFKNKYIEANNRIDQIIEFCQKNNGMVTVDELSKVFKITYRTLHRIFVREIGVTPKEYLRILRFNRVCKIINKYPELDWSDLIYSCGYYDQSHFIHDFKDIIKATPYQFLKLTGGKFYLKRPYFIVD